MLDCYHRFAVHLTIGKNYGGIVLIHALPAYGTNETGLAEVSKGKRTSQFVERCNADRTLGIPFLFLVALPDMDLV